MWDNAVTLGQYVSSAAFTVFFFFLTTASCASLLLQFIRYNFNFIVNFNSCVLLFPCVFSHW